MDLHVYADVKAASSRVFVDGGGAEVKLQLGQCYLKKASWDLQHVVSHVSILPPPPNLSPQLSASLTVSFSPLVCCTSHKYTV